MTSSPRLGASLMASVSLGKAAPKGDTKTILDLLDGVAIEPRPDASSALASAAEHGHVETVKALLPFYEHGHQDSMALRLAARNGSLELISLLIAYSKQEDVSSCLTEAAECGHTDAVQALLPLYVPGDNKSLALVMAARKGHMEIVRMLLPVSDPKAQNSAAFCGACAGGFSEVAELLLPLSNPEDFNIALACAVANRQLDIAMTFYQKCDLNAVQKILFRQGKKDDSDVLGILLANKKANDLAAKTQDAGGPDKTRRL